MNWNRVFHLENVFKYCLIVPIVFVVSSPDASAQIVMAQSGSYFQDFNTLSKNGSANAWVDNQTLLGWYWQCKSSAETTYYSDDGTSSYVGRRCYGTTNDSDRAIGGLCSIQVYPFDYGLKLRNGSSQNISTISLGYTGEQWKVVANSSPQQLKFYYKISTDPETSFTFAPTTSNGWYPATVLDFTGPQSGSAMVLNGNDPSNRQIIPEYTIPLITPVPPGYYIYFRWRDLSASDGKENGLAIDDVTVRWTIPAFENPNIWTGALSNDWFNGSNWSMSTVPGPTTNVQIAQASRAANSNDNITIKNLQIVNGGALTIEPGKTITVTGNSIFEGPNSMILKSPFTLLTPSNDHAATASFLCNGIVSGTGTIRVERFISQYLTDTDGWHFFSTPVNTPTIDTQFMPTFFDDLYTYWEEGDTWLSQKTTYDFTQFINGLGYLMSYNSSTTHSITGLPNNSDILFKDLSYTDSRGWHLLGNPFPCALTWGGAAWGISGISGVAKLLNSGGTYTDLSSGETIPAMNGFFVKANSTTNTLTIPKSARLHAIADGWKQTRADAGKKIKLVVNSNSNNTFAETRIILNENATTGYDPEYDSPYLSGMEGTPLFYSVTSTGKELSTNTLPETASLVFNLEFTPGVATEYTLKSEISDDWIKTSTFVLEDKLTNTKHVLSNGSSFSFSSHSADTPERFRLLVDIITGIDPSVSRETIQISSANRLVHILFPGSLQAGILKVFDMAGQQLIFRNFDKAPLNFTLPNAGCYLIRLQFNKQVFTRKILVL